MADKAIDGGLEAVDQGVKKIGQAAEKGAHRLSKEVENSAIPAPMRASMGAVLSSHVQPRKPSAPTSEEARRIREKYPDRVPVICQRSPYSTGLPEIPKSKFVVPGAMLCGEFKYMIHKLIRQSAGNDPSAEQTI